MKKVLLLLSITIAAFTLKAQNPYPIIPLDSVQRTSQFKLNRAEPIDSPDYISPRVNARYGDTVRIEGYVLFDPRYYGLSDKKARVSSILVKDTICSAWGGVEILCDPAVVGATSLNQLISDNSFFDNVKPGYKIRVTGVIKPGFTAGPITYNTQLCLLKGNNKWNNGVEVIDYGPYKPKPLVLTVDSIITGNSNIGYTVDKATGEKWEGVYVELRNISVYNDRVISGAGASANLRWTWSVTDATGNAISIRDYSGYFRNDPFTADSIFNLNTKRFIAPPIGKSIEYIRGVIQEYNFQGSVRYGIAPLYPNDIGPGLYTPPTVVYRERQPVVPSSADSVNILCKFQRNDTNIVSARAYFSTANDSTTYNFVQLKKVTIAGDTDIWTAKIPPMPNGSKIYYYLKAYDANNVSNRDTVGTAKAYIVIDGGVNNIRQIQYSPYKNKYSIWNGDSAITNMSVRALVTSTDMQQGAALSIATIQQGYGVNAAAVVFRKPNDATTTWKQGDSVLITSARVAEYNNITTLFNISASIINKNNALPLPLTQAHVDTLTLLNSDVRPLGTRLMFNDYEGQLINFDTCYVISNNPDGPGTDFQEFSISKDKNATTGFRVNDLGGYYRSIKLNAALKNGQKTFKTTGILYYLNGNWKINPRDTFDIDIDTVIPRIALIGANPKTLIKGTTYTEQGANLTENRGAANVLLSITGTVNKDVLGAYNITYTATDKALLTSSVVRTVNVSTVDNTKPTLTLKGKSPDSLLFGTSYVDAGATAIDDLDDDITNKIVRTGKVDSSKIGSNILTYTVSDMTGNIATITRTVVVGWKTGITENETKSASVMVYPSPASNVLYIETTGYKTYPIKITLSDLLGRDLVSKQINTKIGKEEFDVSTLKNGIYFVTISNAVGSKSIKFVVSGK